MVHLLNKIMHYEEYLLITLFFVIEQIVNNFSLSLKDGGRLFNNIVLKVVQVAIYVFVGRIFSLFIVQINQQHFGLFYLLNLPEIFRILIGVTAIDFSAYWVHRLCHGRGFFWNIHRVHHSDLKMDTTTNWRGHPIESLYVVASRIAVAALLGVDFPTIGVYVMILVPVAVLSHVNLKFPAWLDKSLGLILVTPNFHKVHHDDEMEFTNSNYGACFIIWDRIFGTFKMKKFDDINFGLKDFEDKKKQTLWYLILSPFTPFIPKNTRSNSTI